MPGLLPAPPPPLSITSSDAGSLVAHSLLLPAICHYWVSPGLPGHRFIPGSSHDREPDASSGPSPFPLNFSSSRVLIPKLLLSSAVTRQLGEALLPLTTVCLPPYPGLCQPSQHDCLYPAGLAPFPRKDRAVQRMLRKKDVPSIPFCFPREAFS